MLRAWKGWRTIRGYAEGGKEEKERESIMLTPPPLLPTESADVLLTVPAAWDAAGCAIMREAAIKAGLVRSSQGGDKNWRDRLVFSFFLFFFLFSLGDTFATHTMPIHKYAHNPR